MPLLSNNSTYSGANYTPSYNSAKLRSGLSLSKITIIMGLLVLTAGGGYFGFTYYKNKDSRAVSALGKQYVGYIVKGEYDKAYVLSAQDIKGSRTAQQFANSMSSLKTSAPYMGTPQKVIFKDNEAHYYLKVDNLPATASGRTDGIFALTLINDKGWKVNNISVQ